MRSIEQDTKQMLEELYKRRDRIKGMYQSSIEKCEATNGELKRTLDLIEDQILALEARQMNFNIEQGE